VVDLHRWSACIFHPATIFVAVLGYLGRGGVAHFFARDLEKYKNQLSRELEKEKQQATVELERAKRELDGLLSERQTRFSLMHQKRAEVIAEIYGLISNAETAITGMVEFLHMEQHLAKEFHEIDTQRNHG
jgi:hypothetical protein